jgi:hypothetical protein
MSHFGTRFLALLFVVGLVGCNRSKHSSATTTTSAPVLGAACVTAGETRCLEGANAAICSAGAWQKVACRGFPGCIPASSEGSKRARDTGDEHDLGQSGDICVSQWYEAGDACFRTEGARACSHAEDAVLECQKGRWSQVDACKSGNPDDEERCLVALVGPKKQPSPRCQYEMCDEDNEGHGACAHDGKALFVCRNGRHVKERSCTTCSARADGLHCE